MANHPYEERYRKVWESTLANGELTAKEIEKSRYYFETDLNPPQPKNFNTYGIVSLMPMPIAAQEAFTGLWQAILTLLGQPLTYGVEPQNRHVELVLFSRPEEVFSNAIVQQSIEASVAMLKNNRPEQFTATFNYPFITPDGTVVVPGFPEPTSSVEDFRDLVRNGIGGTMPKRQSDWFHISLGRILEPVAKADMKRGLQEIERHWGKQLLTLGINQLLWTHEKQWYMVQKDILHELALR